MPDKKIKKPSKLNQTKSSKSSTTSKNSKSKEKKQNLIKLFRKAVHVVYFCLFIQAYSKKFTNNRFKMFNDKYLQSNSEKLNQDNENIINSLKKIDLLSLLIKLPNKMKKFSTLELPKDDKKRSYSDIPNDLIKADINDRFEQALNFVNFYLKSLKKTVLK
jgi:hypothetical protein